MIWGSHVDKHIWAEQDPYSQYSQYCVPECFSFEDVTPLLVFVHTRIWGHQNDFSFNMKTSALS